VVRGIVVEAHKTGIKVVMSSHDFQKTPPTEELVSRLQRQQALGADILKIALTPLDAGDVLKLLDATWQMRSRYTNLPMLTMSMGGISVVSRLSGEVFGSELIVGMIGQASAPGQVEVEKLREILDIIHGAIAPR
jgi:3-dehydroquinate dehydratase-1